MSYPKTSAGRERELHDPQGADQVTARPSGSRHFSSPARPPAVPQRARVPTLETDHVEQQAQFSYALREFCELGQKTLVVRLYQLSPRRERRGIARSSLR